MKLDVILYAAAAAICVLVAHLISREPKTARHARSGFDEHVDSALAIFDPNPARHGTTCTCTDCTSIREAAARISHPTFDPWKAFNS